MTREELDRLESRHPDDWTMEEKARLFSAARVSLESRCCDVDQNDFLGCPAHDPSTATGRKTASARARRLEEAIREALSALGSCYTARVGDVLRAALSASGAESMAGWVAFDAANDARCPISGNPVHFVTYNGATVGHRNDDGSWYDSLCIGQDGTPNDDYTDEQVTHWAPLLPSPPKVTP
jgi:hypothetical protein